MQSRSQRKIINVVLISFHRSLRVCTLNGLQALHATLLHSECNVATDRMVCSILCLMLRALTRSRPQDQLPFSFCLQNCMSVARFLGLCDHMHRFLSKFCCLKRSLGEAALCYILRHELWGVLEDGRKFSFSATALCGCAQLRSDCCAPQLAETGCSATDVVAARDGFCELRGRQAVWRWQRSRKDRPCLRREEQALFGGSGHSRAQGSPPLHGPGLRRGAVEG